MSIKTELQAFDELTPVSEIEQWARANTESALHHDLKYDDAEGAAHLWRLDRIRRHIACFIVDTDHVRETISLSIDRPNGDGYRKTVTVLNTPDLRAVALHDAIQDYSRLQKKHEHLGFDELLPVWAAIDEVKKQQRPRRSGATGVVAEQPSLSQ